MSEHIKNEEKMQIQNSQIEKNFNKDENSLKNRKVNENVENQIEKEDVNFDNIDFNINPFNSDNSKNDEKSNESNEFVLEEKEDEIFELNNISLNPKFHTSNELIKVDFFQDNNNIKEKEYNKNNLNNIINNNFTNYITNINPKKKDENKDQFNDRNNNSRKSYNNSNILNLNLEANSFIPKKNNNNNNYNNFFSTKGRTIWVCSFCHNINFESKKYIYFYNIIFYSWRNL